MSTIVKYGKVEITEDTILIYGFTFKGCDFATCIQDVLEWVDSRLEPERKQCLKGEERINNFLDVQTVS